MTTAEPSPSHFLAGSTSEKEYIAVQKWVLARGGGGFVKEKTSRGKKIIH